MKLNAINLNDGKGSAEINAFYQALNCESESLFAGRNIIEIFESNVATQPEAIAVQHHDEMLTYAQLDQQSNRVAHFLRSRSIQYGDVVGIIGDKSNEMICWILGILKVGASYLPVNTGYPVERARYVLNTANVKLLVTTSKYIRLVDQLQWQCIDVDTYVCIDVDDVYTVREPANLLMNVDLWEYVGRNATDDISGGGWFDSYTGERFSRAEMDEYADNVFNKLQDYFNDSVKVLEIGCASGISMFRIAPHVKEYWGIDISQIIIDYNEIVSEQKGYSNIKLRALAADQIKMLGEKDFDIVIINSVIQCFSGYNYLRDVLKDAIDLIKPTGIIFAGDIMDLDLQDELQKSLISYKQLYPERNTKLDLSNELFVSRTFWDNIRCDYGAIASVACQPKLGAIKNELTAFRYDAILTIDKRKIHDKENVKRTKCQLDRTAIASFPSTPVNVTVTANTISNIIFTSGSTGVPKGVMVTHGGIVHLVKDGGFISLSPGSHWLQTADLSFDPSTMEIFGALLNGATLHLFDETDVLNVKKMKSYINEHQISIMQLITPIFHEIAGSDVEVFRNLKTLIVGGEAMSARIARIFKDKCSDVTLINAYGPTENTVVSTYFKVDGEHEEIPIGKRIGNTEVYIVDGNLRLQPEGVAGELCLAGPGLAKGYLNDRQLTDEKFIDHPLKPGKKIFRTGDSARFRPDGNIQFLGRIDNQVKIRGFRIELSEIEKTLMTFYSVDNAIVTLLTKAEEKFMCAYIVAPETIDMVGIKEGLAKKLPAYMIPDFFLRLDKLPLTNIGKVDKKMLPLPEAFTTQSLAEFVAPRTAVERKLVSIWQEVLEANVVGVQDNFFLIGGNSLKIIKLLKMIDEIYPDAFQISDMFSFPTVEAQAAIIEKTLVNQEPTTVVKEIEF